MQNPIGLLCLVCLILVLFPCHNAAVDPPACTDTFEVSYNTQAIGGFHSEESSLASCQKRCIEIPKCVGIDFNNGTSSCWLHLNVTNFSSSKVLQGIDSYRLTERVLFSACIDEFSELLNMHAAHGVTVAGGTLAICKDICYLTKGCVAVDFNNGTKHCWIHTNVDDLNSITPLDDVNLYRLQFTCGVTTASSSTTTKSSRSTATTTGDVTTIAANPGTTTSSTSGSQSYTHHCQSIIVTFTSLLVVCTMLYTI